jgi:two-component system, NarL family, sensor histidine kinase DevS
MADTDNISPPMLAGPAWALRIDVLVILLALGAAILLGGMLWLRAQYPSAGFLAEPAPGGWRISSIGRDSSQGGVPREWLGATLTRACLAGEPERCVPLQPEWMTDSPIVLPSASAIENFVRGQQALLALASRPGEQVILHAQTAGGSQAQIPAQASITLRPAREFFTERFGLILLAAIMLYTVGCAMLAFVRRTREVWLAFAMCAGFFLFMLMRSWYTNRTWAQPEATWWIVIELFRVGVLLCGSACLLTIWNLRLRTTLVWLPRIACALMCTAVLLHALGVIDSAAWGYRYVTLGFLLLIIGVALSAWWMARNEGPGEQLRSKNFGRILLIGFLPLMITMPLWSFRPDLQQIAYLQNMAVGLSGIPVVIMVSQSAHYQLHGFWWRLWLVLVAAVLGLLGAAIFVVLSGASAGLSLALMLALAGFVIYALRGWLEKRLIGKPPAIEQFLPQIMALQGLQGDAMEQAWRRILQDAFAPQSLAVAANSPAQASLAQEGDSLLIPALGNASALTLTGAGSYTRSFGRSDEILAGSLHALALQGFQARESFVAGAVQERRRIAADLHDDIGGKLLHLANSGGHEAGYARNTLEDLRTITRGLSAQPRPLAELLADIQYQLSQRADRANIELLWQASVPEAEHGIMIGSRQSTVLARICSELLRNAMQHQDVSQVHFEVSLQDWWLQLRCHNDGAPTDPAQWQSGLGTTSIRRRVHDLQGRCAWATRTGGGASFEASWPLQSWLSEDTGAFQIDQLG